jgi:uncharacterized protein (TIGR03084 family)
MQPAFDFQAESNALAALIAPLSDAQFDTPTQFKGWTINMILRHLHVWNIAADLALCDAVAFDVFLGQMVAGIRGGRLPDFEASYLGNLAGQKLHAAWVDQFEVMTAHFAAADPKARVKWVGPDMSVMSSITARLMETWAHGQAVYDVLGQTRQEHDRISNIVRLGVNTYNWTWKNRRVNAPGPMPQLRLTAPSGALWEYGDPSDSGMIEGAAHEFCQVVTQCRNIADTELAVTGHVAAQWMAVAQCFAGPPVAPPERGVRFKAVDSLDHPSC